MVWYDRQRASAGNKRWTPKNWSFLNYGSISNWTARFSFHFILQTNFCTNHYFIELALTFYFTNKWVKQECVPVGCVPIALCTIFRRICHVTAPHHACPPCHVMPTVPLPCKECPMPDMPLLVWLAACHRQVAVPCMPRCNACTP